MSTSPASAPSAVRVLGAFCWHELHTRDRRRAAEFYTKLIGWTTAGSTNPADGWYTEWVTRTGVHVGGMMDMPQGTAPEVPPSWAVYVNVDDVDDAARRTVALGGRLLAEPIDVPQIGRLCPIADPTGAVVHLFKGINKCGEQKPDAGAGQFCWTELLTHDPSAAERFYTQVLGWTVTRMPMEFGEYTIFWVPGANPATKTGSAGGMMKIAPEWGPMPSSWLVYIQVDDVDRTAALIAPLGGQVFSPPCDIPGTGRFAVAADPAGAMFAIFKPL
ncbi:MAG: VOC family protein [Phycisphaerales bacterium]